MATTVKELVDMLKQLKVDVDSGAISDHDFRQQVREGLDKIPDWFFLVPTEVIVKMTTPGDKM